MTINTDNAQKKGYNSMIKIKCDAEQTLELSQITDFQGDLKERTGDDMAKIKRSILKHGIAFPLFIWRSGKINYCLDGHCRTRALREMQAEGEIIPPLPVVYIHAKNKDEAKELLLKLNSQYGHMTAESVAAFLDGLEIDINDIALPEGVLDLTKLEIEETKDDDAAPDLRPDEVAKSQRGELYRLGRHYLYCGDSTSAEDMAALMGDTKADLIVTDPPYNVALGVESVEDMKRRKRRTDGLKIENDAMDDATFKDFLVKAFNVMLDHLKRGGAFYIWHADLKGQIFREALEQAGGQLRQCLIWVKNALVMGRQDWQWRHEPCLYGWKNGANHYWDGRRDLTTVYDEKPDYKKMSKEKLLEEISKLRGENIPSTIIYEDKPARNEEHPTMKPVRLFQRLIKNSSKEDDAILDPFGGSGTTIIAAEKLNRTAYVMELDPHYCDVIRRRWTKWAEENDVKPGSGALN
jgi:site-specific DNA-methyltransferase (adenine-specific)